MKYKVNKFVKSLLSITLALSLSPCSSFAKEITHAKYKFKKVQTNEAKTTGVFKDAIKDEDGFLWVAMWGSLLRYDGHEIVSYRRSKNVYEPILIDETITALTFDSEIGVLVGSVYGLVEYKDNRFNHWVRSDEEAAKYIGNELLTKNHGGIPNDKINSLYIDSEGVVWLGWCITLLV